MNTPNWLTQRGCTLKLASDRNTWYVLCDGRPDYSLVATPVAGKFGATIRQTINGRRIESTATFASKDDAIRGGLEDLRNALGWG